MPAVPTEPVVHTVGGGGGGDGRGNVCTEHAVLEAPEHPPLLYLPAPQVAHVLHVPADVEEWPERYFPEEHDGGDGRVLPDGS
jgi:hypothetical protein